MYKSNRHHCHCAHLLITKGGFSARATLVALLPKLAMALNMTGHSAKKRVKSRAGTIPARICLKMTLLLTISSSSGHSS